MKAPEEPPYAALESLGIAPEPPRQVDKKQKTSKSKFYMNKPIDTPPALPPRNEGTRLRGGQGIFRR